MTYRRLMSCCVFLFLIGVLLPMQKAAASASRQPLLAGGSLVVNGTTDADARDGFLSLREAMNVANGVTGPFSPQERSQMTGCTFNAGGMITGGCGRRGGYHSVRALPHRDHPHLKPAEYP